MPQFVINFSPLIDNSTSNIATSTPLSPEDFAFATPVKIWGIGLFFVTLISSCAAVGIMLMPCLSKRTYNTVLTYFIGLGVGSLSGSAIFHLLPQVRNIIFMSGLLTS
uniref:Uncharacterized protein n=1 Tax=Romanomermis culicivorax TaxID=13658 RepID=A0A915IDL7_ROMCU